MLQLSKKILALAVVVALVAAGLFAYYAVLRLRSSEWEVSVVVDGRQKTFKLGDLEALAQRYNISGVGSVKATPLLKLVQLAGYAGNTTLIRNLSAVGADGYSVKLDNAFLYLNKTYVVLAEGREAEWGPARLVVEGMSRKHWVKQLVRVEAGTGPWVLVLEVDNETRRVLGLDELRELAVELSGLGKAVPLSELLQLIGVSAQDVVSVEFVGADGYRVAWDRRHVPDAFVLLVAEPELERYGPLRGVVLSLSKKAWVHHLVAVNVLVRG